VAVNCTRGPLPNSSRTRRGKDQLDQTGEMGVSRFDAMHSMNRTSHRPIPGYQPIAGFVTAVGLRWMSWRDIVGVHRRKVCDTLRLIPCCVAAGHGRRRGAYPDSERHQDDNDQFHEIAVYAHSIQIRDGSDRQSHGGLLNSRLSRWSHLRFRVAPECPAKIPAVRAFAHLHLKLLEVL
jgi:hypothetical protein